VTCTCRLFCFHTWQVRLSCAYLGVPPFDVLTRDMVGYLAATAGTRLRCGHVVVTATRTAARPGALHRPPSKGASGHTAPRPMVGCPTNAGGRGFALAALVSFAERGFQQANRITLTKSCRCNNSSGDDLARHFRLTGVA
jgi:hypothetical protein